MRLGQEVGGLKGLQKQAKCYLAALNSLRLVSPDYAWIVKPAPSMRQQEEFEAVSPKRDLEGRDIMKSMLKGLLKLSANCTAASELRPNTIEAEVVSILRWS